MRRSLWFPAGALLGVFWTACSTNKPPSPWPTPFPTSTPAPFPTPTPTPPPSSGGGPLVAMPDGTWQRDGRPFDLRMVIVCCKGYPDSDPRDLAKAQNWPLTSKEFLQWIT